MTVKSARNGSRKTVAPAVVAESRGAGTLASMAYERLREEIIGARFASGQRLHIQQLCERYGMGLSPMREALNRLSRDGLVSQSDRRGFRVTPLSEKHLAELTRTRIWINELALRQSIANGDDAWEEQVVLAYHRLSRIPRYVAGSSNTEYNPNWEKSHRAFHAALIAACGSHWLRDFCEQLFDAADCYRHLSRVSSVQRKELRQDEHKLIMDAALARDTEKAVELIRRHVVKTADLVCDRLAALAKKDMN
jgi:GntR family carbon starvation induced transcriptional regulator